MTETHSLFITCPRGIESLLAQELADMGVGECRPTAAGVHALADLAVAYRICLWSRLANKVLLELGRCSAKSKDDLYAGVQATDWSRYLSADGKLWIEVNGTNHNLRNTQFSGQIVKDAIVDQLRTDSGLRPTVHRDGSDLSVNLYIQRDQATINLDVSGESLHRRGYRQQSVLAPLKQNLAAALLMRAGWPQMRAEGAQLIDPCCGSGTLLIEAAMMAADIAPGMLRSEYAFQRWPDFRADTWEALKAEASERREKGLAQSLPEIRGYDIDPRAIRASQINAEAAGVDSMVRVMHKALVDFKKPTHGDFSHGLLITNPPYGERLGEQQTLLPLYEQLGVSLKRDFSGWRAGIFTGNPELARQLGLSPYKKYKLSNGAIPSELLLFEIFDAAGRREQQDHENGNNVEQASGGTQMLINRLQKNQRQLSSWLKTADTNCYRIYDADMPEYAVAIDVYADKLHVQEYQAPKSVDTNKARTHLREALVATQHVFDVPAQHIALKQRQRQRGNDQYQAQKKVGDKFIVNEGRAQFKVDLESYLDTGLFLDHRLLRRRLYESAMGKQFLNLFCYTATATVQAALGGASSSVSVDMSNTYLDWARENFALNNIGKQHQLVQADCLQWLQECRQGFDIIMLDPPSFSNSKRMESVLDVQRDHVKLIKRCLELLNPKGTLYFSTNLRKFKFDYDAIGKASVQDISKETIDKDFQRRSNIHQCFLIQH